MGFAFNIAISGDKSVVNENDNLENRNPKSSNKSIAPVTHKNSRTARASHSNNASTTQRSE